MSSEMGLEPDEGEQQQRTASIQTARALIREHLSEHLIQNPNATYTSWIAALHPENVQVDPRLLNDGNPWISVWEEAAGGGRRHLCRSCRTLQGGWGGLIDTTVGIILTLAEIVLVVLLEAVCGIILWLAWFCGALVRRLPHAWPQLDAPVGAFKSVPAVLVMFVMLVIIILAGIVRLVLTVASEIFALFIAVVCGVLALSPAQGSSTHAKVRKVVSATQGAMRRLYPPVGFSGDSDGNPERTGPRTDSEQPAPSATVPASS